MCLATLIFHVHSGDHPGIIGFYWTGEAQKYSIINPMELLIQRAASYAGSVVLPEGQDPRVMKAAAEITRRGFARVVVLASPSEAQQACAAALPGAVQFRRYGQESVGRDGGIGGFRYGLAAGRTPRRLKAGLAGGHVRERRRIGPKSRDFGRAALQPVIPALDPNAPGRNRPKFRPRAGCPARSSAGRSGNTGFRRCRRVV